MDDNKNYPVKKPEEDTERQQAFEGLLKQMRDFDLNAPFTANVNKCTHCIYHNLCDSSLC